MRPVILTLAMAAGARAARVVPLSISKATPEQMGLDRRSFPAILSNNRTAYYTKIQVGTPPQTVTLHVDTGSADLWVLSKDADLCESERLQQRWGYCVDTFDPDESSTYETVDRGGFDITYLDQTGASGDYFTDNISLGNSINVTNVQMGLAEKSTNNVGLIGIGYNASVAAASPYPNIIDLLYEQGLIPTKAYSLYLNDFHANSGELLFGGIDTEKFIGELKTIPVIPNNSTGEPIYDHFTVAVTGVTVGFNSTTTDLLDEPIAAILDSGTSFTYVPPSMANPIFSLLNVVDDTDNSGEILVDCALRSRTDLFLTYQFNGPSGPVVNVSAAELIVDDLQPYIASGGLELPRGLPFPDERVCRMGIYPTSDHDYLLGDTFLRSAYVVYDLSNNVIGMAQSNVNATKSNVVEIAAGGTVPLTTGVATPAAQETSGSQTTGGGGTSGGTGTGAPQGPAETTSTRENAAARGLQPGMNWQAVGVAGAVGVFTLFGTGVFVLL